jgi:23S rRNA (uracil1939-C5)-methyltransferase
MRKKWVKGVVFHGIADKGMCVGKDDTGKVIFAEGAVPGDTADVFVLRNKKGVPFGFVKEVQTLSEERTLAICQHFDHCGGCKWQNLKYSAQLKYKTVNVKDAVRKIAKMKESLVLPAIGSEEIFHYRNKLEFTFSNKRWLKPEELGIEGEISDRNGLGFHISGAFDKVLDIRACLLQDDFSNTLRNHIREYAEREDLSFFDLRQQEGLLRTLVIRNTTLGEWMVTLVFFENRKEQILPLMKNLQTTFPQITSLQYIINDKKNDTIFDRDVIPYAGKTSIREQLGPLYFDIGVKSFFQTNTSQAKVLYDIVKEYANLKGGELVFDLYTGLGSIALYVADQCKQVVGIEEVSAAIEDAWQNAQLNSIINASFYAGDVKDLFTHSLVEKYGKPDVVITDPPRAGMHKEVVDMLLSTAASTIVYVSCNPSTQARDLALLNEKYDVEKIQPVDMFPHTHHIESVALLRLRQGIQ